MSCSAIRSFAEDDETRRGIAYLYGNGRGFVLWLKLAEVLMAKVEIYTTPWCGYCARAKALLDRKGVAYEEIDVTSTPGAREQMIERAGGRRTVPQIFVDGNYLGDSDAIIALDRAGKLDPLLSPA